MSSYIVNNHDDNEVTIMMIPMDVTLVGIVTDVREVHDWKALPLIEVNKLSTLNSPYGHPKKELYDNTVEGMTVAGSDVLSKAFLPMDVTLIGMVTDANEEHPLKADSPLW